MTAVRVRDATAKAGRADTRARKGGLDLGDRLAARAGYRCYKQSLWMSR